VEPPAQQERRDPRDRQEVEAKMVPQASKVSLELLGPQDRPAAQGPKEPLVLLVQTVR